MSHIRQILLAGSAGMILAYTWALYSVQLLVPNLLRITSLIVAVVSLLVLYGLTIWAGIVLKRKSDGKMLNSLWLIGTVLIAALSFVATAFVIDWGPGVNIRALSYWSFLPEGNLLVAGGRPGVSYLVFLLVFALGVFWGKITPDRKIGTGNPSGLPSSRRSKTARPNLVEIVSDDEGVRDFLRTQ